MFFLNKRGLTMIEFMVVCAIITVMSSVGIIQYHKFIQRARQAEAKAMLSVLFTTEMSFKQQWDSYTTDLKNLGFAPQGQNLRYVQGFYNANPSTTGYPTGNGCPSESISNFSTNIATVNTTSATWYVNFNQSSLGAIASANSSSTSQTFQVVAFGCPGSSCPVIGGNTFSGTGDVWVIDNNKLLSHAQTYFGN